MGNIKILLGSLLGSRSYSFYKLTGARLVHRAPEVLAGPQQHNQVQVSYLEDLKPPTKKSFNLAAYVNDSTTLQKLIDLGVSLYDIENLNRNAAQYYVSLDFERDCVKHIRFLVQNGLKERNLGRFISEFPMIFKESIDNLQTRIDYLGTKNFSKSQISQALNRSALILSQNTKTLDFKLGQLQIEFNLPAIFIRTMVAKYPPVIALPETQYKLTKFTLKEEFGFRIHEMHQILREQPTVLDILRPVLIERLDLVHNVIGLSHETISKFPKLITGPKIDIKHRHQYLKILKRDQYDPTKPLYVPPSALYKIDDETFCARYAKTDINDYMIFLRSH